MTTSFVFPPTDSGPQSDAFPTVSLTTARLVVRLIEAASEALNAKSQEAQLYLERAAEVLITDTIIRPRCARGPQLALWQRRRVLALIQGRLGERLSLDELAAATGTSRSHFARAFKGSFDQTPYAYLMTHRIATAQMAMISGDQPLCEIALDCGFADQAHFSRSFRKVVGSSPNVWRRLARIPDAFNQRSRDACPA